MKLLTPEEQKKAKDEIWQAIVILPQHNHNKNKPADTCEICVARTHMATAFRYFIHNGKPKEAV